MVLDEPFESPELGVAETARMGQPGVGGIAQPPGCRGREFGVGARLNWRRGNC